MEFKVGELVGVMPDNKRGLQPGMYRVVRVETENGHGRRDLFGTYLVTSTYDRPLLDYLQRYKPQSRLEVFQEWGFRHEAMIRFEGAKVEVEAEGITAEGDSIGTAVVEWERLQGV